MEYTQPTSAQLRSLRDFPRAGPIQMVNLCKFRDHAEYPDGSDAALTGREAYQRYLDAVTAIVAELGGRVVWSGTAEVVFIGDDGDDWDEIYIAEYPSRAAFLQMIARADYQAAHRHREAGLAHQRLIQCRPNANETEAGSA